MLRLGVHRRRAVVWPGTKQARFCRRWPVTTHILLLPAYTQALAVHAVSKSDGLCPGLGVTYPYACAATWKVTGACPEGPQCTYWCMRLRAGCATAGCVPALAR